MQILSTMFTLSVCFLLILGKTGVETENSSPKSIEHLSGALSSNQTPPFSEAVRSGDLIFLSGMLGTVPGTRNMVPGGVKGETKQIMDSMRKILETHGSSMDRIVKCTVILADIKEWAEMNEVYATYFRSGKFPARTAFESSGLLFGARVEIECIAAAK